MKWDPEDYAANHGAQLEWARSLAARLALSGDGRILDVGCGDGGMTAEFARRFPDSGVVGIDRSVEFVEYARNHHPASHYPNLSFECQDARSMGFADAFELVYSNAALHWVDDHPAFLRGCSRALRAGGRLAISCGGAGNASQIVGVFEELIRNAAWRRYFKGFTFPYYFHAPSDYDGWLPAAGFQSTRCELVEKEMIHESAAALTGWIRTTWLPYTQRVPDDERGRFIEQAVTDFLARYPADELGRTHVRMVRLEVEAVKIPIPG